MSESLISSPLMRLAATLATGPKLATSTFAVPEIRIEAWGGETLEGLDSAATVLDGSLRLDVVGGSVEQRRTLIAKVGTSTDPLHGTSSGGHTFKADRVSTFGRRMLGQDEHGGHVGFQAYDWSLLPDSPPSLWFGWLRGIQDGALPWRNLRLGPAGTPTVDLYLSQSDGYDYVISRLEYGEELDTERRDLLFVDTKDKGVPDRDAVVRDLLTMQFIHARPLRVDVLRGAGENGELLPAFVGSSFGDYELREMFAHEPIVPDGRHCWADPAFARLAPRVRQEPPGVRLAMEYFLYSFRAAPDDAYLKLTVALEGLAIEILRSFGAQAGVTTVLDDKEWIVGDIKKWRDTLKLLKRSPEYKAWKKLLCDRWPEIRLHALATPIDWSSSLENSLGVGNDVGLLPAGRRVEAAFRSLGLEFDQRMKAEAARWHTARHTGIAKRADGASLAERLAVLRTMLVALLLRSVGYEGSVIGYEQDARGSWCSADPEWWGAFSSSCDALVAQRRFGV